MRKGATSEAGWIRGEQYEQTIGRSEPVGACIGPVRPKLDFFTVRNEKHRNAQFFVPFAHHGSLLQLFHADGLTTCLYNHMDSFFPQPLRSFPTMLLLALVLLCSVYVLGADIHRSPRPVDDYYIV